MTLNLFALSSFSKSFMVKKSAEGGKSKSKSKRQSAPKVRNQEHF